MAIRTHNSHIKVAIFLFFLLFLPLAVFYASNTQLNENRSSAAILIGDGSGCSAEQILYQKYNITVVNIDSCEKKGRILDAILGVYSYSGFREKMGDAPLKFANTKESDKNWAYTYNKNFIRLFEFETRFNDEKWEFIISHELFHILTQRNADLLRIYPFQSLAASDPNCFRNSSNGKIIKSYAAKTPENAKGESFAESGALYIFNKSPLDGSIGDFRNDCPASYRWFDENIF